MRHPRSCCTVLVASMVTTVWALDGVVAPESVAANSDFQVTFQNGNPDQYRVYLAAALAGVNGPTCYLQNSTTLSSPLTLSIPATVGPSADYYSIAIADVTTSAGATYSNRFNFMGGTGNYTQYETHLGGAPFWDADALPCDSYGCARQCAEAGYPDDLTDTSAYETMKQCILNCQGVSPAASQTGPAHATSTGPRITGTATAEEEVVVTIAPGVILTAVETVVTEGGSTVTEAALGSQTVTLGGAEVTISSEAISLASNGIDVGGSATVAFSTAAEQTGIAFTQSDAGSATGASAAATSSGAARKYVNIVGGPVGLAGLAVLAL